MAPCDSWEGGEEHILVASFSDLDSKILASKEAKVDFPDEEGPEMATTKTCLPFWTYEVASDIVKGFVAPEGLIIRDGSKM